MPDEFKNAEDKPEEPGLMTVMTDRKFRRGTWTMFFWTFFFMWTGIDALNMYSNVIIVKMNEPRIHAGKEPFFNAEVGSVLVGLTQFVGSLLAYFSVTKFNRITLLFWGHIAMGLLWFAVAMSNKYEWNMLANLFISIFIIIFSMTEGPLIWMYGAEVLNDSQLGIGGLGFTVNLLCIAYLTEYIIKWIEPEGLFFIFSGTTLIGAFWIKAFLKET
jgi:SP family facilitated glucose transporter-like MFS transporter 1